VDRPKKIRKKKAAEMQSFKSAAFIIDSDDDEEADLAFFAREKELRREMMELGDKHGGMMKSGKGKGKRKRGKGKDDDNGRTDLENEEQVRGGRGSSGLEGDDEEMEVDGGSRAGNGDTQEEEVLLV
jgi:replication fork protection complex subunit Tof1/Swi1